MDMSEKDFVVKSALAKGRPLPAWVDNEPELFDGDEFYIQAWYELDTCRQVGMDVGMIPWDKIVLYGQFHGLENDVLQAFIQIIREMDAAFMKRKEQKREVDKHVNKPRPSRR